MQWFVNDASLQGQFGVHDELIDILRGLLAVRLRHPRVKNCLRVTRSLPQALVAPGVSLREFVIANKDKDLIHALMSWLDRTGPFVDDDRSHEDDDYFEYQGLDVTSSGLGEATRRTKLGEDCATFSFERGAVNFAVDPLTVDHGLAEDRLGQYDVDNRWDLAALEASIASLRPPVTNWEELVTLARERFQNLAFNDLHLDRALSREPFESSISDRALRLLDILDRYMEDRRPDGSIGPAGKELFENFFLGDRAVFSNESATNIEKFREEMTFRSLDGRLVFAPWHGKISHRHFRLHFEWPVDAGCEKLSVLYLGPKITKA